MGNFLNDILDAGNNYTEEDIQFKQMDPSQIVEYFSKRSKSKRKELTEGIMEAHQLFYQANKELTKDFQFEDRYLETLYTSAYDFYKEGLYVDAFNIFKLLILIDTLDYRFAFGLGLSLQQLKYFVLASKAFKIASIIRPTDPNPWYYAADCFISIDNKFEALLYLEHVVDLCCETKKYHSLKEHASLLFDKIITDCNNAIAK